MAKNVGVMLQLCHGIRINDINNSEIAMLTIRKLIVLFKACVLKTTIMTGIAENRNNED